MKSVLRTSLTVLSLATVFSFSLYAGENVQVIDKVEAIQTNLNVVWTCVAAFLVFFMQAGFAMVESGFTRAKNTVNILMKNLMDFSVGSVVFLLLGFGLMFGKTNGLFGTNLFGFSGVSGSDGWSYTFLIFQTVFAATAATIVSGAMAERTKFKSYLVYSFFITAFVYPVFGSWAWGSLYQGGGWLENLSTGAFTDFAGSTVVHSIGGWMALAGALFLGARRGKFDLVTGKPKAIPGHNIPIAALGVFILWFGWFGFNPGSTTVGDGSIGRIAVVTNIAAAAGAISSLFTSWFMFKKPDATMSLNGALAGLVAITAGCNTVTPFGSLLIGIIAGIAVVFSVVYLEKIFRVDDPVGAVSVHGVCGAWGTLACGLFNAEGVLGTASSSTGLFYGGGINQLISQFLGVSSAFIWAFGLGSLLFYIMKKTIGLRVSMKEEEIGLDIEEHGMEAYFTSK
ncbi:MAG: ammonium transporter [Oligoflexia bacterium]|nr:ammonium transporter [Oligoflexia bacterium]